MKKAVYIAIGVNLDGRKDVLGMWVGENESAKFWATVLNGLKNRGVEDIFIACTDNLTGFDAAIHAVFGCSAICSYINDEEPGSEEVKPLNPALFFLSFVQTRPWTHI